MDKAWQLVKSSVSAWMQDRAPSMGAALAYYALFSLIPLLLLIISLVGIFFGEDVARSRIVDELTGLVGEQSAEMMDTLLRGAAEPGKGLAASVTSLLALAIGATSVLAELRASLDHIFRVPPTKQPHGLWGFIRTRFLSLGMVLGLGFLLLVSLTVSAALTALSSWWSRYFGDWAPLLRVLNFFFDFAVITAIIAMIYKLMPSVRIRWHETWIGALVTAFLLAAGKYLIGLYLGHSDVADDFGAAAALIIVVVWIYYSTQIFFLGAEFTSVFARRTTGKSPGQDAPGQEH
jgi:membrane protein